MDERSAEDRVHSRLDPTRLEDIRITFDLDRLSELIGAVALKLTQLRGIEPPDFDGEEMRLLAISGWQTCCQMHDRAEFAASVLGDLEKLDKDEVPQ